MAFSDTRLSLEQILDAERAEPTVQYQATVPFVNEAAFSNSALGQRGWHPRPVSENPGYFRLRSQNYDLLNSLYNDVLQSDRPLFLHTLESRISEQNPFTVYGDDLRGMGETRRTRTELPLIAEFLIRHEEDCRLIKALLKAPLRPALTRLLLSLEELIALDYRLVTDRGYDDVKQATGLLRSAFANLQKEPRLTDTKESNYRFHVVRDGPTLCDSLAKQAARGKYLRMVQQTADKLSGKLEGIEVLRPNDSDDNFDVLAQQVRAAIEGGTPLLGLDRLHTFMVRYIRNVYTKHFDRSPDEKSTPNSLLGQVANDLRSKGLIKSAMGSEILKSCGRILEEFNHVRNKQTFAHANDDLLTDAEAYFIYQSIAATVRYLKALNF